MTTDISSLPDSEEQVRDPELSGMLLLIALLTLFGLLVMLAT